MFVCLGIKHNSYTAESKVMNFCKVLKQMQYEMPLISTDSFELNSILTHNLNEPRTIFSHKLDNKQTVRNHGSNF